jgi:hypothetical protein
MSWQAGGVCLNCVTRRRRYAAAVVRHPPARSLAVMHCIVIHSTVIHGSGVKANVPSGPATNGWASITASTLSGP